MKNLCLLFTLLVALTATAQDTYPNWVNYTDTKVVNKILEDGNTLWLATAGGLVEHNIKTGKNQFYNRGNSPIPSNDITDMEIDKYGYLWLATTQGLISFYQGEWNHYHQTTYNLSRSILTLDNQGELLFIQPDAYLNNQHYGQVFKFNGTDFEPVGSPIPDYHYTPTDIAVNPVNDDIWVTSYTYGIYIIHQLSDTTWNEYTSQNTEIFPFESAIFNHLEIDNQGTIWSSNRDGVFYKKLDEPWQKWEELSIGHNLLGGLVLDDNQHIWIFERGENSTIQAIIEVDTAYQLKQRILCSFSAEFGPYFQPPAFEVSKKTDNTLYIETANDGVYQYKNEEWVVLSIVPDFSVGNRIERIHIGHNHTWIKNATYPYYGVPSHFQIRNNQTGEWAVFDNSILPDSSENSQMFIVSELAPDSFHIFVKDRIWVYKNGVWIDANLPDVHPEIDEYRSIVYTDPSGRRWILDQWTAYVLYESPTGWKVFDRSEHGNSSGNVSAYFTHPETGEFWMGGSGGISIYDGENWRIIDPEDYQTASYYGSIVNMVIDKNNVVWAATYDGLLRIENNTIEVFENIEVFGEYYRFHALMLDNEDNLWVGLNNKIAKKENDTWKVYDHQNSGVPNGMISQLEIDSEDNIWVGSNAGGLAIFNPNGLSESFFINEDNNLVPTPKSGQINIFPNPKLPNSPLCIQLSEELDLSSQTTGIWYNALGQRIAEFQVTEALTILPETFFYNWSAGVYYLSLFNGNEQVAGGVVIR